MKTIRHRVVVCVLSIYAASISYAVHEPSAIILHADDWSMTPIIDKQGQPRVASFLALRHPQEVAGDNIVAVWYIRDAVDSSVWHGKSWSHANEWEVVAWVMNANQMDECLFTRFGTFTDLVLDATPLDPVDYSKGFAAADPFLDAIESSPDRDSLVEVLKLLGYQVADIPIDYKGGTGNEPDRTNKMLSALAAGIENQEAIADPEADNFSAAFTAAYQAAFAISWPCYPITFTVPGQWSAWSLGSWTQLPCSANTGGSAICCYTKQVCRYRTIVQYTVTLSCAVGVSGVFQEEECWTHAGWCTNSGGGCPAQPSCELSDPQTPGNTPPPGTCPKRRRL